MEEYKSFFENYEISNFGNVRRLTSWGEYKTVNGHLDSMGYRKMDLRRPNKRHHFIFHQVVAKHFIGDKPEGMEIDHIDRNKQNNNVNNLRYVTHSENMKNVPRYHSDVLLEGKERTDFIKKIYEEKNREKILERHRNYQKKKYEETKIKRSACTICNCGRTLLSHNMSLHLKSKYHKKFSKIII